MITLNREKCAGCGDCVEVCPQNSFVMGDDGKTVHAFPDRCMECGACKLNCRAEAISMEAGAGCFVLITKEMIFGKEAAADGKTCS
jgi:NAD-dependent dihydropyrimidine dehydrogenase PreA subunit